MTLVKIDHPRRIDRVIDYFGQPRRAGSMIRRRTGAPPQARVSRAGAKRHTAA
ncbi:MAG TPA: hypothetical protein VLF19_07710 [Methylomirabilota bacterium]|nr:hypothetical protein [Methylomirabilota bacterium]